MALINQTESSDLQPLAKTAMFYLENLIYSQQLSANPNLTYKEYRKYSNLQLCVNPPSAFKVGRILLCDGLTLGYLTPLVDFWKLMVK